MKSSSRVMLSTEEAAAHIGVSPVLLKQLRLRRRIPAYRVGYRTFRFDQRDLDAFLEKVRVNAVGMNRGSTEAGK